MTSSSVCLVVSASGHANNFVEENKGCAFVVLYGPGENVEALSLEWLESVETAVAAALTKYIDWFNEGETTGDAARFLDGHRETIRAMIQLWATLADVRRRAIVNAHFTVTADDDEKTGFYCFATSNIDNPADAARIAQAYAAFNDTFKRCEGAIATRYTLQDIWAEFCKFMPPVVGTEEQVAAYMAGTLPCVVTSLHASSYTHA